MIDGITRRHFHQFLAAGAAAGVLGPDIKPAMALETATITWTSDDPHLSGNYAPIGPEIDAADLPVIAGRIPLDLSGAYMRNGPNPLYKPIAFTYPMDGDGMIHAVYFDNGRARYRNRFVQTPGLAAERHAGRAIYGSFAHPVPIDSKLLHPGDPPGPFKNGAFINVIQHGGHLLALNESTTSYEINRELDTIGEWKAGTDKPLRLGAHNRRHPKTGALFAIDYSHAQPTVQIHQIDASGTLVNSFPVALAAPTMIHDFVLTERYIVLLVCPAVFDSAAAQQGQSFLQWRPGMGTRIGLIALDGSTTQWLDADPFFVFHFANAFERGGNIFIDYVQHESLALGYAQQTQKSPTLHRMTIDLAARKVSDAQVVGMVTEFPRINDAHDALPTRFVYLPTLTDTLRLAKPPSATFNTMMKVNIETGDVVRHDFGNKIAGEAVFIPRGGNGEDNGYLAIYAFDHEKQTSDLVLLDAAHSLGNAGNQVDEDGLQWTWLRALEMSESFADLRRHVVYLNNPDKGGFFVTAVRKRARTASTGEYFLLLGIASLCDFGHIADQVCKRRTWQGFYARLDHEHALALSSCVLSRGDRVNFLPRSTDLAKLVGDLLTCQQRSRPKHL